MTLDKLRNDAIEELEGDIRNNRDSFDSGEPHDRITEIADSSTPVCTHDLLLLAADNLNLATVEPELGPAFDGSATPANIIAANIYEYIQTELWDFWHTDGEEMYEEFSRIDEEWDSILDMIIELEYDDSLIEEKLNFEWDFSSEAIELIFEMIPSKGVEE